MDLKQTIKEYALYLGFSLVGVTTGDPLAHKEVFEFWLEMGRQGEMGYLNSPRSRQCRAHPQRIIPECRSVLVLGVRYPAPTVMSASGVSKSASLGRIASYAWGVDYHEFLPGRLGALVQFIEEQAGHSVPNRWYTDTGPILERELAMRAGLGWIGKNTCLINPTEGSYFLLAEVLLGLELEPDPPFINDRCGTCTRCLRACPTSCILPNRTLDARRCLSYLTIELKGPIPLDLRPMLDDWVFGCDVCQQVCPWNRFAGSQVDPAFDHLLTLPEPVLLDELKLSALEFNRTYQHSPLRRARRAGYLRNIAVVLGNHPSTNKVIPLSQVLMADPEPLVRLHAAWALGRIGSSSARQVLKRAFRHENDALVLQEIQNSLTNG